MELEELCRGELRGAFCEEGGKPSGLAGSDRQV